MGREQDMTRDVSDVEDLVAAIELTPDDYQEIERTRAANPLLNVNHLALACRDAAATRRFYEDLLGLPLVNAMVTEDPFRKDGSLYCHFFFELGDGNCLAFFDHTDLFEEKDFAPKSGFHQHIAMSVESDAIIQSYRERLEAAGVATKYIDHGLYHSLYFSDPNGLNLELTHKPAGTVAFEAKIRKISRKLIDDWIVERDQHVEAAKARSAQ